jgi:hypothetical protein
MAAFTYCEKLTSVTFQGMITADNFRDDAFYGDLRDKYLAGGIGTYTTENPELNAVWTYKGNS